MEGSHVRLAAGYAKQHGMRVAGIFYDAIPWLHPEIVLHWTSQQHADYMTAFAGLDVVIPISEQSARDYIQFAQEKGLALPPVRACGLASQIFGQERETKPKETTFRRGENPVCGDAGAAQKPCAPDPGCI